MRKFGKNILKLISNFVALSMIVTLAACSNAVEESKKDEKVSESIDESITDGENITETEFVEDGDNRGANKITYSYNESTKTLTVNGHGNSIGDYDPSKKPSSKSFRKYLNDGTTEVIIIKDVVNIGKFAFSPYIGSEDLEYLGHQNIESQIREIKLPDGLQEIGKGAFMLIGIGTNNTSEMKLNIPNSVRKIDEYAFYGCDRIVDLDFADNHESLDIEESAFECCSIKDLKLPEGTRNIGADAFSKNSMEKVYIPKTLNNIEEYAFYCNNLTSLSITDEIDYLNIGRGAFALNPELERVYIPERIEIIDSEVFDSCSSLKSITLPNRYKKYINDILGNAANNNPPVEIGYTN